MITNPKKNTTQELDETVDFIVYLKVDGSEVEESPHLNDQKTAFVSKEDFDKYGKVEVYKNGESKYFLKQFRGGRSGHKIVDPYGMFAKPEDLSAFLTKRGHRFCEYIKVPRDIYFCYVSYLETRDPRYFRTCEKYIVDTVK